MPKTAYQKIVDAHILGNDGDGNHILALDRVWCHEITTTPHIMDAQKRGIDVVFNPNRVKAMIDHVVPSGDTKSAIQAMTIRNWAKKHGIEFLDVGRGGICHAVIPEKGWILPGQIGVMGDSHTCTHGAFCALTAGVGTTVLGAAIMTGIWVLPPQKVVRVNFTGKAQPHVYSKDVILSLLGMKGSKGFLNAVVEMGGSYVDELGMDARMTMTNMIVEGGGTCGMMMVDKTTINYLWPVIKDIYKSKEEALKDLSRWNSDPACEYDEVITIDVSRIEPVTTINYSPADVVPVEELQGKKVNQVVIGSCTNGRIEDLRIAATLFTELNKPVHPDVRCIVIPATSRIWRQAEEEGLLWIFKKTGCYIADATCGPCLGMSCGVLAPREVAVATTNRNYEGRMGKGGRVHLVSPATAVFTAISGVISVPDQRICSKIDPPPRTNFIRDEAEPSEWKEVSAEPINYRELCEKALETSEKPDFSGRAFFLERDGGPAKNVNTDDLIPATYLRTSDRKELGKHCLEYMVKQDDDRKALSKSSILVAGEGFGEGSSREHAVWALMGVGKPGIRCVIASSFQRIFQENMFRNRCLCIQVTQETVEQLFKERPSDIQVVWDTEEDKPGYITWDDGRRRVGFTLTEGQKEQLKKDFITTMLEMAERFENKK